MIWVFWVAEWTEAVLTEMERLAEKIEGLETARVQFWVWKVLPEDI